MHARGPETSIEAVFSDRPVDLIEEDFDCAIRVGAIEDSRLVARTFAHSHAQVVAAPGVVNGRPHAAHPEDLNDWPTIACSVAGARAWPLERGDTRVDFTPRAVITLSTFVAVHAAARAGGGAAMIPEFLVADDIRSGALVSVLEDWRTPRIDLRLLYPQRRHPSARLRTFIDTVVGWFPDLTLRF